MHRAVLAVPIVLLSGVACGKSAPNAAPPAPRGAAAAVIARQTQAYERAGATHAQAACLAGVTARIKPVARTPTVQVATAAQQLAIDRCDIPERTMLAIAAYTRAHFPPPTPCTLGRWYDLPHCPDRHPASN